MWTPIFQGIAAATAVRGYQRFRRALADPEAAQRQVLGRVLGDLGAVADGGRRSAPATYEEFARRTPVSDYATLEPLVAAQRLRPHRAVLAPGPVRFVPTSGSTAARKWIPVTPASGREFDAAAAAWMFDLVRRQPSLLAGRHYWSLSWLPDELRGGSVENDDLSLLPPVRARLLRRTMAVGDDVARLSTAAASRRATVVRLAACRDLRLVSVWSPTFLLALLDELDLARDAVVAILESGRWDAGWEPGLGPVPAGPAPRSVRSARTLRAIRGPAAPKDLRELWPRLELLSAWDSATSAGFASLLRRRLPGVPFQGKGLWATEGVVTIPFADHYPAALTSHFLEFRDLETSRIEPVWRLQVGQAVQPLLTTGAGLVRYALDDRMRVTGRLGRTPCLRFESRLGGEDLVGEKLTVELALSAMADLERELGVRALCLCAVVPHDAQPRYVLLAETGNEPPDPDRADARAEMRLRRIHHYALARDAQQLGPVRVVVRSDARAVYRRLRGWTGGASGAEKIEAIVTVTGASAAELLGLRTRGGERSCVSS